MCRINVAMFLGHDHGRILPYFKLQQFQILIMSSNNGTKITEVRYVTTQGEIVNKKHVKIKFSQIRVLHCIAFTSKLNFKLQHAISFLFMKPA